MVTPICGQIKNVIGIMRYITNIIQNNINTLYLNVIKCNISKQVVDRNRKYHNIKSQLAILAP